MSDMKSPIAAAPGRARSRRGGYAVDRHATYRQDWHRDGGAIRGQPFDAKEASVCADGLDGVGQTVPATR